VTVKQFQKFIKDSQYPATEKPSDWAGASPRYSPEPDCPVQQVNWFDAILYCNWLSTREGMTRCYESTGKCDFEADGYRLPTEAEWEYACRAGSPDAFCFGNDMQFLTKYGWFGNPAKNKTHPCGKLLPSAWDLFDMHGNVWEWCWDWYTSYPADPLIDPKGPDAGSGRVIRGGAFDSSASGCQSACRDVGRPVVRDVTLGFRVSCGR
jgi:formylglycine-generating enzyme required for sulfatase activity